MEKNRKSCICVINPTAPARDWQLGSDSDSVSISMIEQDGVRLGDITPSTAITEKVDSDDDPQTALELMGI